MISYRKNCKVKCLNASENLPNHSPGKDPGSSAQHYSQSHSGKFSIHRPYLSYTYIARLIHRSQAGDKTGYYFYPTDKTQLNYYSLQKTLDWHCRKLYLRKN